MITAGSKKAKPVKATAWAEAYAICLLDIVFYLLVGKFMWNADGGCPVNTVIYLFYDFETIYIF